MDVFVAGKNRITLNDGDLIASYGGEGVIYRKGSVAFKVYKDPANMIPTGKIQELSVLDKPYIIRPLDVLLSKGNQPLGYTMRFLENVRVLNQFIPPKARTREGITPEMTAKMVQKIQEGVSFAHSKGVLLVDLNEMNFMTDNGFREVYFIDVNSYKTKSYPATAIMAHIRYPGSSNATFSELTDWYSFGIVSFTLFVGIHPFKGNHPLYGDNLAERMPRHISVLNKDVGIPKICLPLDVIPQAYRDWYQALFEDGKLVAPPSALQPVVVIVPVQRAQGQSSIFDIVEILNLPGEIASFYDDLSATTDGIYAGGGKAMGVPSGTPYLGRTPKTRRGIVGWLDAGMVNFYDLTLKSPIPVSLQAEQMMAYDGRFYVKQGMLLLEVEAVELANKTIIGTKPVGNVTLNSTNFFDGVVVQDMLGGYYVSLLPQSGVCYQARVQELDGHKIVDAKASGNVLVVVGTKGGSYHRFVYRFDDEFKTYDCRVTNDIVYQGINFIALDSGVCLNMGENEEIEVFSRKKGASSMKVLKDQAIGSDVRFFSRAGQALFSRGGKLYRFSMRPQNP